MGASPISPHPRTLKACVAIRMSGITAARLNEPRCHRWNDGFTQQTLGKTEAYSKGNPSIWVLGLKGRGPTISQDVLE